jgi:hypothetical protein
MACANVETTQGLPKAFKVCKNIVKITKLSHHAGIVYILNYKPLGFGSLHLGNR